MCVLVYTETLFLSVTILSLSPTLYSYTFFCLFTYLREREKKEQAGREKETEATHSYLHTADTFSHSLVFSITSIIVKFAQEEPQGIFRLNQRGLVGTPLWELTFQLHRTCDPRVAGSDFLSLLAPRGSEFRFGLCEAESCQLGNICPRTQCGRTRRQPG